MKENTEPKPESTQDTSKQAKPQNENAFERACRLRRDGVSVARTAAACGVSHTTIRRWETNKKWKDLWEQKKEEIEERTQSKSDTKDETSFLALTALTAELLNNFGLRELKDFCLAFSNDVIENPKLIQTLESVCAKESVSDLQLMNWLRRRTKNV